MTKVSVIDCGIGNLFSISCALEKAGLEPRITSEFNLMKRSDAIVLPGVGNFRIGSEKLQVLKKNILELIDSGVLVLGVCLGMQLFFGRSEESSGRGLGLFKGKVIKLPTNVKIPHIGWNTLDITVSSPILENISGTDYFYFVHSYYANPDDKKIIVAKTSYGLDFPSVISSNNVYGTQFHPEKSGKKGAVLMHNFARIIRR